MTPALSDLAARITAASQITADDVLGLRAQVYGADSLAPDEMEALAELEQTPGQHAPEWGEFLAEAMVDFVVHQEDPEDYVDDAKAGWVMKAFAAPVRAESGLESLARILQNATEVPPAFASFVVGKMRDAMVAKGAVDAADVDRMKRIVYAGGGEGNLAVTREEAEALFAINAAVAGAANDPAWPDFFAHAVGASVLAVSPYTPETKADALRDEAWLDQKDTLGEFMGHMAGKPDLRGAIHEILHPDDDARNEWKAADAKFEADETDAGKITDDEARWLVGQLSQGSLSDPERRLIEFLKAEASEISDLLKPLLGPGSGGGASEGEADAPAPVFGHRKTSVG